MCVCVCKKGQPTNSALSLLPAQPQLVVSLCRFFRLYFKHALRLFLSYYFTCLSPTLLACTCLTPLLVFTCLIPLLVFACPTTLLVYSSLTTLLVFTCLTTSLVFQRRAVAPDHSWTCLGFGVWGLGFGGSALLLYWFCQRVLLLKITPRDTSAVLTGLVCVFACRGLFSVQVFSSARRYCLRFQVAFTLPTRRSFDAHLPNHRASVSHPSNDPPTPQQH